MTNRTQNSGFTLIEILVYTGIIAIVFVLVLTGIINLWRASETVRVARDLNLSAASAMESMTREIHQATSTLVASSTFGTTPGVLVIATDNASTTGGHYRFSVSNNKLYMIGGATTQQLTSNNVSVTSLTFWNATTTNSEAIRVRMVVSSTRPTTTTRTIYGTAVLRGSYLE
jgi:type II secretory pathway pseudopilin PulG